MEVLYRSVRLLPGELHAGIKRRAGVVELVDAPDSKSGSARSVGSIPTTRTTFLTSDGTKVLASQRLSRSRLD